MINRKHLFAVSLILMIFQPVMAKTESYYTGAKSGSLFQFHNRMTVNFHHYFYWCAQFSRSNREHPCLPLLSQDQKGALDTLMSWYQSNGANDKLHHMLFSDSKLTWLNASLLSSSKTEAILAPGIRTAFVRSLDIYKQTLWPKHELENMKWLKALQHKLEKYESGMVDNLASLLPSHTMGQQSVIVDIVYRAGNKGAYTSSRTSHVVINTAASDYQDWAAFEMLFHEYGHARGMAKHDQLRLALSKHLQHMNKGQHSTFWHAILFYTVGELTQHIAKLEGQDYRPYAFKNELFSRKWRHYKNIVRLAWGPYVDGRSSMNQAIQLTSALLKAI